MYKKEKYQNLLLPTVKKETRKVESPSVRREGRGGHHTPPSMVFPMHITSQLNPLHGVVGVHAIV